MAHGVQVADANALVLYVPLMHCVQPAVSDTCPAREPLLPAGHMLQAAEVAAPVENVPIGQSVHVVCGSVL
jgi:hypothetical protein